MTSVEATYEMGYGGRFALRLLPAPRCEVGVLGVEKQQELAMVRARARAAERRALRAGSVAGAADRDALGQLWRASGGSDWQRGAQTWCTGADVREWGGVEDTDETGCVLDLRLDGVGLRVELCQLFPPLGVDERECEREGECSVGGEDGAGERSRGGLAALSRLEVLWLQGNGLRGHVPAALGALGRLPSASAHMSRLRVLYLFDNELSGDVPAALGDLVALEALDLSGNRLSGNIPTALVRLSLLQYLGLQNNALTGLLPPGFGAMPNLTALDVSGNRLLGELPFDLRGPRGKGHKELLTIRPGNGAVELHLPAR